MISSETLTKKNQQPLVYADQCPNKQKQIPKCRFFMCKEILLEFLVRWNIFQEFGLQVRNELAVLSSENNSENIILVLIFLKIKIDWKTNGILFHCTKKRNLSICKKTYRIY